MYVYTVYIYIYRSILHEENLKAIWNCQDILWERDKNPSVRCQSSHSAPKLNGSCMSHWHCRSWCSASGSDRRAPVPVPRNQSGHAAILRIVQLRYDGMTRKSQKASQSPGQSIGSPIVRYNMYVVCVGPCMIKWAFFEQPTKNVEIRWTLPK